MQREIDVGVRGYDGKAVAVLRSETSSPGKAAQSLLKAVARFRPLTEPEQSSPTTPSFSLPLYDFSSPTNISISDQSSTLTFSLFRVFPPSASQALLYEEVALPLVSDVLDGFNATIFAYGQTGSGKTFTMMGPDPYDEELRGIMPRAAVQVFQTIETADVQVEYTIQCSAVEIYKEKLQDLLDTSGTGLKIKENVEKGIYVDGLSSLVSFTQYVASAEELFDVLDLGASNRSVAATRMNQSSSRSHQLVLLQIGQKLSTGREKVGKLYLVDLAGSEKAAAVMEFGETFEEMKKINLSLSALGKVILALVNGDEHVPYRDSKLTRLLQESLGGNYKTALVVTCSPHPRNVEETLSSLRFGERAGTLKTRVRRNIKESPTALIQHLQAELDRCRAELSLFRSPTDSLSSHWSSFEPTRDPSIRLCSEECGEYRRKWEELSKENEELRETMQNLEAKLDRRAKKAREMDKQLVELSESSYNAVFNYSESVRKNEELEARLEASRRERAVLVETIKRLETQLKLVSSRTYTSTTLDFVDRPVVETEVFSPQRPAEPLSPSLSHRELALDMQQLASASPYVALDMQEMDSEPVQRQIYLLRNQLVQAAFINAGMSQAYEALEWRLKLMELKQELNANSISRLHENIRKQALLISHLHSAYTHMLQSRSEAPKHSTIIRRVDRHSVRLRATTPFKFSPDLRVDSRTASMVEPDEQMRAVRSSLGLQEQYRAQLSDLLSAKTAEAETYLRTIEEMETMVFRAHKLERAKWIEYLAQYKANSESELLRLQVEVRDLNKVLAYWVERYTDLQRGVLDYSLEPSYRAEQGTPLKHMREGEREDRSPMHGASFSMPDMSVLVGSRGDLSPVLPDDDQFCF